MVNFPQIASVKELSLGDDPGTIARENQYGIRRVSIQWRGGRPDNLLDCEAQYQRLSAKAWILTDSCALWAGPHAIEKCRVEWGSADRRLLTQLVTCSSSFRYTRCVTGEVRGVMPLSPNLNSARKI